VDLSWESLDRTRETTKAQIERDMEELEKIAAAQLRVLARISRQSKTLKRLEAKAKSKTICLLDELEEEEESERVANGGFSNGELEELSRDLVAHNNNATAAGGSEVWSAWDVPDGTGEPSEVPS